MLEVLVSSSEASLASCGAAACGMAASKVSGIDTGPLAAGSGADDSYVIVPPACSSVLGSKTTALCVKKGC